MKTAKEWYKEITKDSLLRKKYTDLDYKTMQQYAQYYYKELNSDLIEKAKAFDTIRLMLNILK